MTYTSRRYTDDMVGFWVAFEQRTCCDVIEKEVNDPDDTNTIMQMNISSSSNDQSCSSHEYVVSSKFQYAPSMKRSERGRIRTPVPRIISNEALQGMESVTVTPPQPINRHYISANYTSEGTKRFLSNYEMELHNNVTRTTIDHTVVAVALDEVEIIMNSNDESEGTSCIPECHTKSIKHANVTCSDTTITVIDAESDKDIDVTFVDEDDDMEEEEEEEEEEDVENVPASSSSNSGSMYGPIIVGLQQQDQELPVVIDITHQHNIASMVRSSSSGSILRDHHITTASKIPREHDNNNTKSTLKIAFRDPIYEVIPMECTTRSPTNNYNNNNKSNMVYKVGDYVDITDGIYKSKTGRIVKIMNQHDTDLVQIDIGGGGGCCSFNSQSSPPSSTSSSSFLLYISPKMLRHFHHHQKYTR